MKRKFTVSFVYIAAFVIVFCLGFYIGANFNTNTGEKLNQPSKPVGKKKHDNKSKRDNLQKKLEKLRSIGYLSGYKAASSKKSVTIYDEKLAYKGLNLMVSGHGPEAVLLDMKGKVLHKWRYNKPIAKSKKYAYGPIKTYHWRRVHLFDNGDLLFILEGKALIKIDKNSKLLWTYVKGAHHDIEVVEDGRIYVLTREAKLIPGIHKTEPVLEDFIAVLKPGGKEIKRVSLLKCFQNSFYSPILKRMKPYGDIFHTNTLEIFDGNMANRSPLFKKGNALISIRYLNAIAVVDMEKEKVLWCLTGMWKEQHQPVLLKNGNILLFDNQGLTNNRSRVLEFDPFSQQVRWYYQGNSSSPFYSRGSGSVQRLPNGNTLITESNGGRAFEVTPQKKIVWEYVNPYRAWTDKKLVAAIFEMIRLEQDFSAKWLQIK